MLISGLKPKEFKLGEHIVAYIDILGTSERIKNDKYGEHFCRLEDILQDVSSVIVQLPNDKEIEIKVKIFSDNILFYLKKSKFDNEGINALDMIICAVQTFQRKALNSNLLTRGSITQGEFYADDVFVYGKALLEAVKLEENIAIYPRVILSPKIIKEISEKGKNYVSKDLDGLYYIDYADNLSVSALRWDTKTFESGYKEAISKDNIKNMQKYLWLIDKHNASISKYENNPKIYKHLYIDAQTIFEKVWMEKLDASKTIEGAQA